MLKPPSSEKTHWVPQPGNPNFLIAVDPPDDTTPRDNEEEKKEQQPFVPPLSPIKKRAKMTVSIMPTVFEEHATQVLEDALAPLYQFVGMLEAESGKTIYYRYLPGARREDQRVPINYGSESPEEFSANNPHLSTRLKSHLFKQELETPQKDVKPEFKRERVKLEQALIGYNYNIRDYSILYPDWFWAQMDSPVFRFLLNAQDYGAMQLAANELGFPLKDLIYSPHTNYMFAQYCAKKFISPKTNAYAAGVQGGQSVYRVSSGFNTSVMANTKWLMGCKLWFKDVYYSANPVKATDLDAQIADKQTKLTNLQNELPRTEAKQAQIERAKHELKELEAQRDTYAERILRHN